MQDSIASGSLGEFSDQREYSNSVDRPALTSVRLGVAVGSFIAIPGVGPGAMGSFVALSILVRPLSGCHYGIVGFVCRVSDA
jgi:hypothetical protein